MFVLCPHCQFLVALDLATGQAPADCPRCGKPLKPPPVDRPDEAAVADAGSARERSPRREGTKPRETPAPPPPARRARRASASTGVQDTPASHAAAAATAHADPDAGTAPALAGPTATAATDARDAGLTTDPTASGSAPPASPAAPAPLHAGDVPPAEAAPAPEVAAPRVADTPAPDVAAPLVADVPVPDVAGTLAVTPVPAAVPVDAGATAETATPAAGRRPLPSFAHPVRGVPAARAGRSVIALAGALALLLVLQLLLADRARLATDARWRPLLSALCGALQCRLPAWHEPAAFVLLARDVRPAREGVLHVSATFRNDARWTQSWPALRLALQDVDGRTVGARTLRPDEYLGRDARVTQSGLAPGQSAQVAFDIAEPAATVVAFTFDFR